MDKIKIALVDDHVMVTKGFRNLLSKKAKFEIVGEASNAEEAKDLVHDMHPDVVLMDINMPGDTGITCTKDIKKSSPKTKVIMLTMHHEEQYIHKALAAGADGYVQRAPADAAELPANRQCSRGCERGPLWRGRGPAAAGGEADLPED